MSDKKTHRVVNNPSISARDLAEYMEASETAKRTIVRDCKFRPIARITQHNEAKQSVSRFIRTSESDTSRLLQEADRLRTRLADTDFDRDLYDHNADYIERFAHKALHIKLPDAERLAPGTVSPFVAHDVKINTDIQFRFRRVTKTNKVRVGAGVLRYAKGEAVDPEVALWQSAFLFGYLGRTSEEMAEPERNLCLTVDAYAGIVHVAPTDAVRRFGNMLSACATIAERWPNIPPPTRAVL